MVGKSLMDKNCPLCRLAHWDEGYPRDLKTELFYDDGAVIVVTDLNPKGYAMRVLAVWRDHVPVDGLGIREWEKMYDILHGVADAVAFKRGLSFVQVDIENHSIMEHEHFQACLRKVKE